MDFQEYWDKSFEIYSVNKEEYSQWLVKYINIIKNCKTSVLDLGCGVGCDSILLTENGFDVIACDFSKIALGRLNRDNKNIKTLLLDISKPLPFENNSFDVVVADLSLHYFDEQTTKNIMQEIKRILTQNGILIARVNSMQDFNHGAGQGEKLEENYYFVKGYKKRFFDRNEIEKYFSIVGNVDAQETEMLRNENSKIVWEVVAKKDK